MGEPLTMVVDYTITIGNIIEISTLAGGGMIAIASLRSTVGNMKSDLADVKKEIKKVTDVLVQMAVTDQRVTNIEQDMRDMKRGKGFIQRDVNGEYEGR